MRQKKMVRLGIALVLILSLVLSACSSGGGEKANNEPANNGQETANQTANTPAAEEPKGEEPAAEEPITLSFYVNYDWYSPKGYGNTPATKWIIENKKVTVEEISAGGNAKQKLGTIIASNEFPDIVQMDRGTEFNELVKNGKIVSYDQYLEDGTMPNLKAQMSPEALNMLRAEDGKLYGIPNWFNNSGKNPNPVTTNWGWLVNNKYYTELGSPSLETWDDIYNFAKQVKEKYPDVVPVELGHVSKGVIMAHPMLYAMGGEKRVPGFAKTDDFLARGDFDTHTFTSIFEDPAYKESLAFINKLFREKLASQDLFTQKLEQAKEKINTGKAAIVAIAESDKIGEDANNAIEGEANDYLPIKWPVKAGVDRMSTYALTTGDLGWNFNAVTVNAKDPKRAFAFIDWHFSDEYTRIFKYGRPGVLWDEVDEETGVPVLGDKWKNADEQTKKDEKLGDWNMAGSSYNGGRMEFEARQADPDFKPSWSAQARETNWSDAVMGKVGGDQFNDHRSFPAGSPEEQAWVRIQQIMEKSIAKLVYAKTDDEFNKEFDLAKSEAEKAGYQKILDYKTKVWQNNLNKMGGK